MIGELLGRMSHLDELVDTLLWEGHQLYPYTPGATKNATPTPFGIVYPPAYAAGSPHTLERVKLQCVAIGARGVRGERALPRGRRRRTGSTSTEPCETDVAFGPRVRAARGWRPRTSAACTA